MTKQKIETPYYSIQFLLREFANGLGTKGIDSSIAKKIDDACKNNEITPALYHELKQKLIYEPVKGFINESMAQRFVAGFDRFVEQYRELMMAAPLDGVKVEDARAFLDRYFLTFNLSLFCDDILGDVPLNSIVVAQSKQSFVSIVINGLKQLPQWPQHYRSLSPESKERLRTWALPDKAELPSLSSINLIGRKLRTEKSWLAFKVNFLVARLWDYFFRKFPKMDVSLLHTSALESIEDSYRSALEALLEKASLKHQRLVPLALELYDLLRLREPKTVDSEERCRILFGRLKYESDLDKDYETSYFRYWMKARLELHCGELELAIEEYKSAFELAIYRQGENAVCIIREAITAACRMPKPDKPFINRLRRMAVMLNIDMAPDGPQNESAKKKAPDIEEWEILAFANMFDSYFTKESFFPGAVYPDNPQKDSSVCLIDGSESDVDLDKPNKKISIGLMGGGSKKMPQLVYFSMMSKPKAVSKLLEAGADVDNLSTNQESAILFAVQEMQVTLFPTRTLQDDNFWALAKYKHAQKTLDTVTAKRKLTPLGCAIQTGRIGVVRKLIEMGASVDRRHDIIGETPLFTAIGLIAHHTRPHLNAGHWEKMKYSKMNLQSVRAHSAGLLPHDLEHLKTVMAKQDSDPVFQSIHEVVKKTEIGNILKYTSADGFRQIAKLLIEEGADPNAKHDTAMLGYTPLMLAIELDEAELVEAMIDSKQYQANFQDTCIDSRTGQRVDIERLIREWRASNVAKALSERV
ncbi:ankyrin repeat domain-containing protein [Vibrio vulnificus]|nr:ankyrin repeat domain-containing protein [Vibrio vulnificus]EIA1335441.1 ankyrin repeat domain-containing protein [Vibrio vulnificus]EIA1338967.1 ankyrin repeat domain-containing protein [Vibrio vulnificus]EIA1773218.1 ankyrin repeat domain-containing protein [Vibrio vulnificus]EIU7595643.1 ankyrin repeat domain-containing protein [Vibrio vulnificus]